MLIPVLKQSFGTLGKPATVDQDYFVAITRAFDKGAAKPLNDDKGALWGVFVEVLQVCLTQGQNRAVSEPRYS